MKNVAVFGLGRFGKSVALELMNSGANVMVVDNDPDLIDEFGTKATYAMTADLKDSDSIESLGIANMDVVVVAMAESLEPSIMSIMTAKELGVPMVIAKAANKATADIFKKVGADKIVYPEEESGKSTAHKILSSDFLEFFDLSESLCIIEMTPKSSWVGKTLKDLNLRKNYGVNVCAVKEGENVSAVVDPDKPLSESMSLLVIIDKKNIKKLEQH